MFQVLIIQSVSWCRAITGSKIPGRPYGVNVLKAEHADYEDSSKWS